MEPGEARRIMGPAAIIGLSTHTREQIEAAAESPVDYLSVGPIWETPTKEGRPATGLELIREAAQVAAQPWFAIGGIDTGNVGQVADAGASRICVVRAIRDAEDPARRPPPSSTRSTLPPAGRSELRPARETESAPSARRESAAPGDREPVPVDAQARPMQDAADSNGDGAQPESFQERMARRYEERNAEARAKLEPLEQGDRPTAVTVGAIASTVLALIFTVSAGLAIAGVEAGGRHIKPLPIIFFTGVLWAMTVGMWRARYWAVLGFQTVLLLVMLASAFGLVVVSSVLQAVGTTLLLAGSATLFYFMIRAMARIQMPAPPGAD